MYEPTRNEKTKNKLKKYNVNKYLRVNKKNLLYLYECTKA